MEKLLSQNIEEYKKQMALGTVSKAYRELIGYLMSLRTHFRNQYSTEFVISSFHQGYMDMSYFSITPESLIKKKLKIGLVFNHEKMQFEIWLLGQNKQVQKKFWDLFNGSNWNTYSISETAENAIIQHILIDKPKFNDLSLLTKIIEDETLMFVRNVECTLK